MSRYAVERVLSSLFVVWGTVTVIFIVMRLVPGDPAQLLLGPSATAEEVRAASAKYGFNAPILEQYVKFMASAARFDFGDSIRQGAPAADVILHRIPATFELAIAALMEAVIGGMLLGVLAARSHNALLDRVISVLSLTAQSLPTFWVGIMLILIFARTFRLLPSAGNDTALHLILPALTLAPPSMGLIARLVRSGLLDVMNQAYVAFARAKGLGERAIVARHAMPNMLIPVVTIIGLEAGQLLGGAVITETVFSWPGMGRLLVDAIFNRDYSIVQGCVAVIAIVYVVLSLSVDLLYGWLDPRIRVHA